MRFLGFLNLKRISGQIAALVVVSIVALHVVITTILLINRPERPDLFMDRHTDLAAAVQLIGAAPSSERLRLFADIGRAFPELDIKNLPLPGSAATASEPRDVDLNRPDLHGLGRRLGPDYRIFALAPDGDTRRIGIALPGGTGFPHASPRTGIDRHFGAARG